MWTMQRRANSLSERWGALLRRAGPSVAVLALTVGFSLVGAGCGGSSKAPSVASLGTTTTTSKATSPSAPLSPQQETAVDDEYAACLNAHGADARVMPGGGVGLIETPSTRGRTPAAQTACKKLLPKGGLPAQTQTQIAQRTAQMLRLATCMRAHGIVKFPDPSADGSLFITPSMGIDPQSPQFQSAQKKCARYFPGGAHHHYRDVTSVVFRGQYVQAADEVRGGATGE